jgi:hypothetical protein
MINNLLDEEKLRLRALEPGDVDFLLAMENDSSVWKVSNTLAPYSRFQIEQYVLNAPNDVFTNRQLRLMIDIPDQENHWKTVALLICLMLIRSIAGQALESWFLKNTAIRVPDFRHCRYLSDMRSAH